MTRDQMLALLRELESAAEAYNAGYSCAKLAEAIAWLEDEGKRETVYCQIGGPTDGWLLKEKA